MTSPLPPDHRDQRFPSPRPDGSGLLQGRVAVVTGAGRGLGVAIACRLAEAGASVVVAGRQVDLLEQVAQFIHDRGGKAQPERCDVADHADALQLVARSRRHFGAVSILVNNAGMAAREDPLNGVVAPCFDQRMNTNVRGVYYTSIGAARAFTLGGSIVNLSSVTARIPDPELTAYSASKGAVESLTRTMAAAFGEKGVRVNAVAPGYTDSPLNEDRKKDPRRAALVVDRTPLRRWGVPEDIAETVCFLASEAAAFITGQVVAVDGGFPTAPPGAFGIAPQEQKESGDRP
jgi:NAD(P)-dependent dehydrogenase (short-subunit alcohol dehydrogenase family)